MTDETCLAALKRGAVSWNAWRAEHPAVRPDLSSAGLRGHDLAGTDLSDADLHQADLRGTILSKAKLIGADLAGANVFKAVFDGSDLSRANLVGARFLNCAQLATAMNWQSAFRDPDLACGASVPDPP
jgi:uncharacterized protein YjbI with pentapeptide repeats